MIISFAWTTEALLAEVKKVTRRDWSKEYAAKFRSGTVHKAYNRQARFGGEKVGDVKLCLPPYPERTRDIPDDDFELEGFLYMEERELLIRGRTPREYFEALRKSDQVLFVVRFNLVYACDRCGTWTTASPFGPKNAKRLCALCWVDWSYHADGNSNRANASTASWEELYLEFLLTKRKGALV